MVGLEKPFEFYNLHSWNSPELLSLGCCLGPPRFVCSRQPRVFLPYACYVAKAIASANTSLAFDSSGRHYSPNGTFMDWWNNKTIQSFKEKAQCFVDQYHEFTVPGLDDEPLHVNGRLTLGENIADAGGLSASFAAWKQRELDHPAQLLPGFRDYTKEQVFFISYANFWCGKTRKEQAVNGIYQDPHSPTWARILVSWHAIPSCIDKLSDARCRAHWQTLGTSQRVLIARRRNRHASCGNSGYESTIVV